MLCPAATLRLAWSKAGAGAGASGFSCSVWWANADPRLPFQCPAKLLPPCSRESWKSSPSGQGTVRPPSVHLHLSLSDSEKCQVVGGHLEPGSLVLKGADSAGGLLAVPLPDPAMAQVAQPSTCRRSFRQAQRQPRSTHRRAPPAALFLARAFGLLRSLGPSPIW